MFCCTAPRGACGDANKSNLINEIKAKKGAKMRERSDVIDDELFDPREPLELLVVVYNFINTFYISLLSGEPIATDTVMEKAELRKSKPNLSFDLLPLNTRLLLHLQNHHL